MTTLELLKALVAMPTVTGQQAESNKALDFIAAFLSERGMHIYRTEHDGFGALVATTQKTRTPRVMLAAHLDVVPASPGMFSLREEDNKLYGRGTYDMKSAIVAYLVAVDELKADLADYDFGIMITTDEETRDLGVKNLLLEGFCPTEAAVLPDGAYDWQIETTAKGAFYGTITLVDQTGHGSRPWLVNSTSMRLVALLKELQDLFPDQGPNTNILNISALQAGALGHAVNQIPATAGAGVDIRTISRAEAARLKAAILALCEKYGATYELVVDFEALEHDPNDPHMLSFAKHIEQQTGVTANGVMSYAVSDAGHFLRQGIACVVTYPIGGGHHSDQEWIDKQSLQAFPLIIGNYLKEMAKHKH